jgi:signal transduction histidine kinase
LAISVMPERRTVADRRKTERHQQRQLRGIIEHLPDGIVIVGLDGTVCFANPAAAVLFGRSVEVLTGSEFGFALTDGTPFELDIVRPRAGGVAAELRVVEIEWDGEPARLVSLRDVTERKLREERERHLALERTARVEAEAASQAKSEFLAMMSHELRTPLNAVLGYTELLDLGIAGTLTDEQRQQLGRIRASGHHLLTLVNEVLDLAKVEAGRLSVDRAARRLSDAVDAAIVLVESQADAKGVILNRTSDADPDRSYVGDEDRVRQIVVNLISNGVKFTQPGERVTVESGSTGRPDAEGRLHSSDRWVFVRVSDNGIGIAPDRIEAIFAPFTQIQSGRTRNQDGTGLGLTISRRLARLMGGDITLRSRPGDGSAFTLWLPEAQADARAPIAAARRISLSGREPRVQGLAEAGDALLRETEPIVDAFVNRLRTDETLRLARGLPFSQLADHVATLLADVFGALVALEESAGQPSMLVADGSDIQNLIAERHGAQRARLGWDEAAIRREHKILREEVDRRLNSLFMGRAARMSESSAVLARLLEYAESVSVRALARAHGPPASDGPH